MRYVGGKAKIARRIESVIGSDLSRPYYEPFVGGGSVFQLLAPRHAEAYASDLHEDLVAMWNGLLFDGWEPPTDISEARYRELKSSPPSPDRGFAGFGCSFGGKWFGGYARSGARNYASNMRNGLLKFRTAMYGARVNRFAHRDYREWDIPPGAVVYLDPPYRGTQGYVTGAFDHDAMWQHADALHERGCRVFVSEYQAPDDWKCVLEVAKPVELGGGRRRFMATEKLFTRCLS